jgi:DNA-binding SARP family transcriptional activator
MEFRILGPFEVLAEGRDVVPAGSKRRALLALLVLHANETLTVDRLVDQLWGERPPAAAAKTVQMHVSRLRKALSTGSGAGAAIATRERGYQLQLDPERLDACRFERLVDEGGAELATGHPERAASVLESALSLWRGTPLADLAYEPFAQREIARLEDLRVRALEQLVEARLALGRHAEVVAQLETLIADHPYREQLRAQLMLALYRCDRQADALQAYQDARRTLVEELGIEPSERLRELERAILSQDARLGAGSTRERGSAAEPASFTATFLFADMEGSTPLLAKLGRGDFGRVLADFYGLIRAAVEEAGGTEVATQGDGFFATFRSASDAVAAAVAAQRAFAGHAWPGSAEPRVRMGVHTGEAALTANSYVGLAVHRAARICTAAHGDQVLVSQTTHDLVEEDLLPELALRDLGELRLKGLDRRERLFQVDAPNLPHDFPPPRAAALEEAVPPPPTGGFVGRREELAELTAGLEDALAGRGRLFVLAGEPGIGKSRLADELVARARARGAVTLIGRCWEAGGAPAYWPWVQSLRAYLRECDAGALRSQLGPGAADLAQILPELRQQMPDLPEPPSLDPEGARFRLFEATADFLRRAAASRPMVLVLDDLHAADAPSLLLLRFLARELGSMRALFVGAYRDVDPVPAPPLSETLADVAREPVTRRIALGGLSDQELAEYVALTEPGIDSAELIAALYEETEGNPLFIGEMVRLLSLEGARSERTGELRLAIPQSVQDVIARRLSHLPEECNRVLVLASVLGREFGLDALARMGGVSVEQLLDTLDEATAAGVVSDVPGGPDRLRFAHVLIRDTLYEGLTTARRVRLHRLAVESLEALYGEQPGPHLAELAFQSIAGNEFARGLDYARRAGDWALHLLAHEESARLYRTALEALDLGGVPDRKARCELLLSLGEAENRAGNSPVAKEAFLEAADIARRVPLPRELARAAAGYGGRLVWARAGDDDRLVPLLEESLTSLGEQDIELRARLLARLAGALRDEPSRDRRDRLSRQAVELARRMENPAALAYALDGRAAAILGPDTVAECLDLGSELCRLANRIGDRERVAAGHLWRLIAQLQSGDTREAAVDVETMSRLADELRQPAQLWMAVSAKAMLAVAAGRLAEAEKLVTQALALGERAQPKFAINVCRVQRYALSQLRGCLEDVEPTIRDLVAEYPNRPVFRCALAHLSAQLGRTEDAQRELTDLARDDFSAVPFDLEWLLGMSLLAETSALLADRDSAPVLYRLLLPWATFNVADTPEWMRGSVSRYLGLLAATLERWDDAARHFEDALAANEKMGARPWFAHTQHDHARMLLTRGDPGDRERAQGLLDRALATYHELGMKRPPASGEVLRESETG